jgi:translocation and assembly module TamA
MLPHFRLDSPPISLRFRSAVAFCKSLNITMTVKVHRNSSLPKAQFAGFLLCLAAGSAAASYRVNIEAPDPIRPVLAEYLDLVRYQERADLSDDQFQFMIATAAEQVEQLTSPEGYFTPSTKVTVDRQGALKIVTIQVTPNKRTIVSRAAIEVTGPILQEAPQRVEALKKAWGLPVAQPFRQADWDQAKNAALLDLQQRRYAAARIAQSEARIDPDANDAQLAVQFDSGPGFTFGDLRISGTKRYPPSIIRNVNPLQPGEEFSVERLLELQRQIQKTPYFGNVIVGIDNDLQHPDLAPVNVQVTEVPMHRVRAGTGYSSDTGANVLGRYSYYDLFDRAWVFDSQVKIEQQRQFASAEIDMPPDQRGYVDGISTSNERTTLKGIDLRDLRVGVKRALSFEKYDTAYTLDYYLDDLKQIDNTPLPPNAIALPGKHRALVPGFAWARRAVDDPIFPRSGNIVALQTGLGIKGLLTDQSFVRVYARLREYVPIGQRDLMIFRTELGADLTTGGNADIPASLLFRAGGTNSVRGYGNQSIGNLENGTVFPTKYLLTASAEYQHWIVPQWGGALFYDLGTAADNWADKTIYKGVGAGVRWRSPVGPVNVDLAYGLQSKQIRPHISLGIAF